MTDETCYACDEPSVGREHVPPKAFVPHGKRDGLFDHVPACRHHNQARSLDDEYTATLCALVSESAYDDARYIGKVARAMHRGTGALGKKVRASMTDLGDRMLIEHDRERTGRVFGDIAAALYFIATGKKAVGPRFVSTQGTYTDLPRTSKRVSVLHPEAIAPVRIAFNETDAFPVRGRDDTVLWYQVAEQGAVRFVLNDTIENVVIWPWCAFGSIFGETASWLASARSNPKLEEHFRALHVAAARHPVFSGSVERHDSISSSGPRYRHDGRTRLVRHRRGSEGR